MTVYILHVVNEYSATTWRMLAFDSLERAIKSANVFIQEIKDDSYAPVEDNNEVEYLDHEHLSTEYTPHGLWDEFGYRIKVVPMDLDSEFYISRTLENY